MICYYFLNGENRFIFEYNLGHSFCKILYCFNTIDQIEAFLKNVNVRTLNDRNINLKFSNQDSYSDIVITEEILTTIKKSLATMVFLDKTLSKYRNLNNCEIEYYVRMLSDRSLELGFKYQNDEMQLYFDDLRTTITDIKKVLSNIHPALKISTQCTYLGSFDTYFMVDTKMTKFYNYLNDEDFTSSSPEVQFEIQSRYFFEVIKLFYMLKSRLNLSKL